MQLQKFRMLVNERFSPLFQASGDLRKNCYRIFTKTLTGDFIKNIAFLDILPLLCILCNNNTWLLRKNSDLPRRWKELTFNC